METPPAYGAGGGDGAGTGISFVPDHIDKTGVAPPLVEAIADRSACGRATYTRPQVLRTQVASDSMSAADWEAIPGYQCPAFLRVKASRLPSCNSCNGSASDDLSCFFVALDGDSGVSLLCSACVVEAEAQPAYRIARTSDDTSSANGDLWATEALLWDAVRLLSPDQLTELRDRQRRFADWARTYAECEETEQESSFINTAADRAERLALLLTWQPAHSPSDSYSTIDGEYAMACMKCDTFPIWDSRGDPEGILDPELQCPNCKTQKWCIVVRI